MLCLTKHNNFLGWYGRQWQLAMVSSLHLWQQNNCSKKKERFHSLSQDECCQVRPFLTLNFLFYWLKRSCLLQIMANKILKTAFTSMLTDPSWIKLKLLSFMKQPSHYLANNLFPAMFKKFQFYKTLFTLWKMVSVYDCWKQIPDYIYFLTYSIVQKQTIL